MAISNQAAIEKMINELQQALAQGSSEVKTREHVRAVRLLCDLILEEESKPEPAATSSAQELEKMMGGLESTLDKQSGIKKQPGSSRSKIDHEEANGDSIFDF